jgi:hypothetical protein
MRRRDKKRRPKWLGAQARDRHPKGYMQWLCLDGDHPSCTHYSETDAGGRALTGLRWEALLGAPHSRSPYLRALLADLADALGEAPATGPIVEDLSPPVPATRRTGSLQDRVLHNV